MRFWYLVTIMFEQYRVSWVLDNTRTDRDTLNLRYRLTCFIRDKTVGSNRDYLVELRDIYQTRDAIAATGRSFLGLRVSLPILPIYSPELNWKWMGRQLQKSSKQQGWRGENAAWFPLAKEYLEV